ncbi:MAG: hypothetical protein ACXWWC_09650, partial [Chitinophagaceae bacterium]
IDFSYQYVLFNFRYVQLNIPIEVGYGDYNAVITDRLGVVKEVSGKIAPISYGLQLILKPIKWAGLSASGGYREVKYDEAIRLSFNGWYYSFGVWADARHLIRSFRYMLYKKNYKKEMIHYK